MRIEVGVGDLVQRTGDGEAQVRYSVAGRSRGQVTLYAVYTVHKKMRSTGFLVQPQNQGRWFLPVWPQNRCLWFLCFGLKTTHSGFPSLGLKTSRCGLVIWPTKQPRQFLGLSLKTKWVVVYRLRHKTNGRMKTVRDTHQDLAACFAWNHVGLGFPSLAIRDHFHDF
jgi:hypothetical protein